MKKIILITAMFLLATTLYAQRNSFTISYPVSFPMSGLKDYTDRVSFRGFSVEYYKHLRPNVEIGLESGWNVFHKKEDTKVYTDGTASISGIQYRNTNIAPVIAASRISKTGKTCSPYLGLGIGALYVNRATDFGLYRITTEAWPFCIRPEAGLTIKLHTGLSAMAGIKYYAAFQTDNLDAQSFLSINMGIVFQY